MREIGKAKKIVGYKEVVTIGNHPYKLPISDARGKIEQVEFVATLIEVVPDHTPCSICKKYIGKFEESMSPHIISCNHKNYSETKINERTLTYDCPECGGAWPGIPEKPYWSPVNHQDYTCFECYGDMLNNESPQR